MSTSTDGPTEQTCPSIGWADGTLGIVAGSGAAVCCTGPLLFGALGMSGIASALTSLPFFYHIILQWIALLIMVGTWSWFLYKWFQLPNDQRWNRMSIITGLILTAASLYVLRSWATHVLI